MSSQWHLYSWRDYQAAQQPPWPDAQQHRHVLDEIKQQPPLVFAGEVRQLREYLAAVGRGEAFLLQAGDCAEEFRQSHAKIIKEKLKIILQMSVVLTYGGLRPVVKVGRIAGQYAKPRSKATETIQGEEVLTFRGDCVNSLDPTPDGRSPDSNRLLRAYHQSASTLNLLRAFTHGGFADLSRVHAWNLDFVKNSVLVHKYEAVAEAIYQSLEFMRACGLDSSKFPQLHQVDLYTSHEGLLLDYESAMSRVDSLTQQWYDCSAHMVWIGDRTRQLDGAHIEFFRGVHNPIGLKVGPSCSTDELARLIERLNPDNAEGRLVLITRFGGDKVGDQLPQHVRRVTEMGARVVWSCDPMHGNTYLSSSGYKTRHFDQILKELRSFFEIHWAEGTVPGGIHLELTGDHVTECLGGAEDIKDEELPYRYSTACDPRLNAKQSLEIAFLVSELLREQRGRV